MKRTTFSSLIVGGLIALDQVTKYLAASYIDPLEPIGLLPVLNLVNVRNKGAAFGIFSGLGNPFFIGVALVAICFIVYMLWKGKDGYVGLSLILSGAVGNLADRLLLGYVRDFIDVYAGTYHWPAFNVADSALTVGIFVLFIGALSRPKERRTGRRGY